MKYGESNKPMVCLMTNSTCYKGSRTFIPKGVLIHSTGANNKNLKRYVQPDNNNKNKKELLAKLGVNSLGNDWNHIRVSAGVNAWIGCLANGEVTSVQTLPWNMRPWGCASGPKGSGNDCYIQFEICEDALTDKSYFNKVYKEACELTAFLCKTYKINPLGKIGCGTATVPAIICHKESYDYGIGSNHSDVMHWFKKHGKTMDMFRNDVKAILSPPQRESVKQPEPVKQEQPKQEQTVEAKQLYRVYTGAYMNKTNAEAQLKLIKSKGFSGTVVKVGTLYKVQVGAFGLKSNADNLKTRLVKAGFSVNVVLE